MAADGLLENSLRKQSVCREGEIELSSISPFLIWFQTCATITLHILKKRGKKMVDQVKSSALVSQQNHDIELHTFEENLLNLLKK